MVDKTPPARAPREMMVTLKEPDQPARSGWRRALDGLNDIVKSPLFVFIVGSGLVTYWPWIDGKLHPAKLDDERNRADIAIVIPLISGMKDDDTARLDASQAMLLELRDAAASAAEDHRSPIFADAYSALSSAATQVRGSPSVKKDDVELAGINKTLKEVAAASAPATTASVAAAASSQELTALTQATLVYIQVDRESDPARKRAASLLDSLQQVRVLAPAVQAMPCGTIPAKTQVRFFNVEDAFKAQTLARFVSQQVGVATFIAKPDLKAKLGTLEVWLGRDVDGGTACSA